MNKITFRKAELRDSDEILTWRNDTITRQNSLSNEKKWIKKNKNGSIR